MATFACSSLTKPGATNQSPLKTFIINLLISLIITTTIAATTTATTNTMLGNPWRSCMSTTTLDHTISKATAADNTPIQERHLFEIINILTSFPSSSHAFVLSFTRRFGRTRSSRAATKCLMLLHRLLRSLPNHHPFRQALLHARANGFISLSPCDFRADNYDATVFFHSYARLVDEVLSVGPCLGGGGVEELLEVVPKMQGLLDLAMECEPTGTAPMGEVVRMAMAQVARESFVCCAAVQRGMPVLLDSLLRLQHNGCVAGLRAYRRAAEQARRLNEFYGWCRRMKLCATYEYPLVEKIPSIQVLALEGLVSRTWHMTSSSSSSSSSLLQRSCSETSNVEGNDAVVESVKKLEMREEKEKFSEEVAEEEPLLIQFEEEEGGWEELLEASIRDFRWLQVAAP